MRVNGLNQIIVGCGKANAERNPHQEPRPTSRINRQVNINLPKIRENLGRQLRNSYKSPKVYIKCADMVDDLVLIFD